MADDVNHKVYNGGNLEAIKPWLMAFNELVPQINACLLHAVTPERPSLDEQAAVIAALITGGRRPLSRDYGVVICPETLRTAPTILRDLADMYEDLARMTGLERATTAWTPNKSA